MSGLQFCCEIRGELHAAIFRLPHAGGDYRECSKLAGSGKFSRLLDLHASARLKGDNVRLTFLCLTRSTTICGATASELASPKKRWPFCWAARTAEWCHATNAECASRAWKPCVPSS